MHGCNMQLVGITGSEGERSVRQCVTRVGSDLFPKLGRPSMLHCKAALCSTCARHCSLPRKTALQVSSLQSCVADASPASLQRASEQLPVSPVTLMSIHPAAVSQPIAARLPAYCWCCCALTQAAAAWPLNCDPAPCGQQLPGGCHQPLLRAAAPAACQQLLHRRRRRACRCPSRGSPAAAATAALAAAVRRWRTS